MWLKRAVEATNQSSLLMSRLIIQIFIGYCTDINSIDSECAFLIDILSLLLCLLHITLKR